MSNETKIYNDCNICFNTIDTDNLIICGNKKCSFKMCSQCTRSYKHFDNKNCPQCRLPITTKQFLDITPQKIENNLLQQSAALVTTTPGRECCIVKCYTTTSVIFDECCGQPNKNIFKWLAGALFVIFVPKILGYYVCKGCAIHNVNVFDAWKSCNGVNDICQPLLGSAIIGVCGGIGYTCFEIINIRSSEQNNARSMVTRR